MAKKRKRFYVGLHNGMAHKRSVFACATLPDHATWGVLYSAVIGPFRTKLGASLCANEGQYSQRQNVNEYEKAAQRLREIGYV